MTSAFGRKLINLAVSRLAVASALCCPSVVTAATVIKDPPADRVVDFGADILPILQRNCLACHSASKAEGEVVLETPQAMRAKREDGALVVPANVGTSRLLSIAARQGEPVMPPEDNKVGAVALQPAELGLLKRWIEQGAKDAALAKQAAINWQPVPETNRPILAAAVAPAGNFAVCSRGGELMVYGLQPGIQRGSLLARLIDPSLGAAQVGPGGAAHLDMVRAVAIHGDTIASAGFRTVKLWRRNQPVQEIAAVPNGAVAAVASADGKRLAIAMQDGSIQIVNTSRETPAVRWKGFEQPAVALAFTGNGETLVAATDDGQMRCWQTASGAALAGWRLSVPAKRMIVLGYDMLVTAGDDLALRVWKIAIPPQPAKEGPPAELTRIEPVRALKGHGRQITSLAALRGSPHQFLSGSVDGSVRKWNGDDGSQIVAWIHGDAVTQIAVSPDGSRFVSVGSDRTVKIWNAAAQEPLSTLAGDYRQAWQVEHVTRLVEVAKANVADAKVAVEMVEKQLAADKQSLEKAKAALAEARKNVEGKTVALNAAKAKHDADAAKLGELGQRRMQAEKSVADAKVREGNSAKEFEQVAAAIKLVPLAQQGVAAAAEAALAGIRADRAEYLKGTVQAAQAALDAATKQRDEKQAAIAALAKQRDEAQKAADAAMAARKDSQAIVARAEESITRSNGTLEVAKQGQAQMTQRLTVQEQKLSAASQAAQNDRPAFTLASFSSDGKQLLLAEGRNRSFVYDTQTFAPLSTWDGPTASLLTGCFADDKHVVIITVNPQAEGKVQRWTIAPEWKLSRTIGSEGDSATFVDRVTSLDFSPDGTLLATGSGDPSRSGQVAIWNVSDGSLCRSIDQPHSDVVFDLAFSPDGEYLASASADRKMKVFRTATGELARTFEGHSDHVVSVSWRANGKQLASAGADHKIKIWDFELGEQRRSIDVGGKEVTAVTYFGTAGQIVASSGDRSVRILNADDGATTRTLAGAAGYLFCCDASESGSLVVAGGDDRVLRVWNGVDGAELLKLEPPR